MADPHSEQKGRLEYTPEEIAKIKEVQRKMFLGFQVPAVGFGSYMAYYLTKVGIWKKTAKMEAVAPSWRMYAVRCASTGFLIYSVTIGVVIKKIHGELLKIDGTFSRTMKEMKENQLQQINNGSHITNVSGRPPVQRYPSEAAAAPSSDDNSDSFVSDEKVMQSFIIPSENKEEESLPSRGLTYEDLRQKNRLYETNPKGMTQPNSKPTSPSVDRRPSAYTPSNEKKNKYGDSWSES